MLFLAEQIYTEIRREIFNLTVKKKKYSFFKSVKVKFSTKINGISKRERTPVRIAFLVADDLQIYIEFSLRPVYIFSVTRHRGVLFLFLCDVNYCFFFFSLRNRMITIVIDFNPSSKIGRIFKTGLFK